jgi:hypothetical protein
MRLKTCVGQQSTSAAAADGDGASQPHGSPGVTPAARSASRGYTVVLIPVRSPLMTHWLMYFSV